MQPPFWQLPVELSAQEEQIVARIRRAKLFVFLRHHRHELFDEAFQQELASLYRPSERGHPPIAPAQLALAVILQAYTGVYDDEVIEATLMDRRWQLVLDCLDTEHTPFSKGTFVAFRKRLIERTIELARHTQEFGSRALRAALDSSPLWGVGRVGDTYNPPLARPQKGATYGCQPARRNGSRSGERSRGRDRLRPKPESRPRP